MILEAALALGFAGLIVALAWSSAGRQRQWRSPYEAAQAPLRRWAADRGWTFHPIGGPLNSLSWRVEGSTAGDRRFTVEHILFNAPEGDGPDVGIAKLQWRCPGARRASAVFALAGRRSIDPLRGRVGRVIASGAIRTVAAVNRSIGLANPGDEDPARDFADLLTNAPIVALPSLGDRWRLVARDEALARRVFDDDLCRRLAALPSERAMGTDSDDVFMIELGEAGLQVTLGFRTPPSIEPAPAVVERVIAIGDAIAQRLP